MESSEMPSFIPVAQESGKTNIKNNSTPETGMGEGWQLKELKPKHKEVCSLLAQGLGRNDVARIVGITPEYVTMLVKQPIVKEYMGEMAQLAGIQLDAMFVKSVDTIGEVMTTGSNKEKIQAARLQLEATKRIGSNSGLPKEIIDSTERLARLSERLLALNPNAAPKTINMEQNENGSYEASKDS